jgi:hypothetical protein
LEIETFWGALQELELEQRAIDQWHQKLKELKEEDV